jgi:uncharacterized membrane protein
MNKQLRHIRSSPRLMIGILVLYYIVGMILFLVEGTRAIFSILTPLSLMMSFLAVLIYQLSWSPRLVLSFLTVFLAAIFIEIMGVQTGVLFGEYVYGKALGFKILDTPVMIGLNWLILIYCTSAIINHFFSNRIIRIMVGAGLMVVFDLVLEYVAPVMDMWSWQTRYPGFRNFLMWFLVASIFHSLFQWLNLKIENRPARYLFLIQFLFFSCIALVTALVR